MRVGRFASVHHRPLVPIHKRIVKVGIPCTFAEVRVGCRQTVVKSCRVRSAAEACQRGREEHSRVGVDDAAAQRLERRLEAFARVTKVSADGRTQVPLTLLWYSRRDDRARTAHLI